MDQDNIPQYASVEQPFGCEVPIVYCPICGKASMEPANEESGEEFAKVTPCDHLAFIFVGEAGEFEYQSEDFEKRFEKVDQEELCCDRETFQKALLEAGYDNKLLAIEITYGGMACGPVWYTDVFGFDYGKLAKEED